MNLGVALFGAALLFIYSTGDWRRSVKFALILVVIEGAIRKWIVPGAADLIYFVKDVVILGAYTRYYFLDPTSKAAEEFSGLKSLLMISALLAGLQAFNLRLASIPVGIFGFKAYLLYAPLCFMLKDLFSSVDELLSFLKYYLLMAIPIGVLGVIQFYSPPESPINAYVSGGDVVSVDFGGFQRARITGTFSYIAGYTTYLFFSLAVLFPLTLSLKNRVWMLVSVAEMILIMGNIFMTGSRAPAFSALLMFGLFLFYNLTSKGSEGKSGVAAIVLVVAVSIGASIYWFGDAFDSFMSRTNNSDSASDRVLESFLDPLNSLSTAGVTGYGTGATHPGANMIRQRFNFPPPMENPPEAELEPVRVAYELGVLGFLVWYVLRFYLIWALWRTSAALKNPYLKHLALSSFIVHLIQVNGQLVTNVTFGVYYWFMAGFIFLLPRLDAYSEEAAESNAQQSPVAPQFASYRQASGFRGASIRRNNN